VDAAAETEGEGEAEEDLKKRFLRLREPSGERAERGTRRGQG